MMKKNSSPLAAVTAAVLLLFVLFMIWYVPSVASLRFQLSDTELSLETSRGRERKQQYEYDQTVAEIPQVEEQLAEIQPQKDTAGEEVARLKDLRKQLRQEKKDLESRLEENAPEGGAAQEEQGHE